MTTKAAKPTKDKKPRKRQVNPTVSKTDQKHKFTYALRAFGVEIDLVEEFYFTNEGERDWRFDFAYLPAKLAIEIDGGQWTKFGGAHNRDDDRLKRNTAVSLGWRVLSFSTQTVDSDPESCVNLMLQTIDTIIAERKGAGGG